MTSITFFRDHDGGFLGFESLGHAGYADKGEDIVCAGISALTISTVNSLEAYTDEKLHLDTDERSGRLSLRFERAAGHDASLLMKSLSLGLQSIQSQYGERFLRLMDKEV